MKKKKKNPSFSIKAKKIGRAIGRFFVLMAEHVLITCIALFVIALLLSSLIYYLYNVSAQKIKVETLEPFSLKETAYQKVLDIWEEEEKKFQDIGGDFNPFEKEIIISEPATSDQNFDDLSE